MPEIEITEDQHEYLQALREDIQRDLVGKYAQVRTVDALEYLIDNHEGEVDGTVASPAAGPDAGVDPSPAGDVDDASEPDEDDESGEDNEADDEASDDEPEEDAGEDDADGDADDGGDDADGEDEESSGGNGAPMAAAGGGGDDGMLSAMMALMDTHDDKWEKASGDTGYEVELPDGSTESANTQDDVRALLFKHYE